MSSERQIAANRANGAKSRGPVTPEGKARSAVNNHRHGLLSQSVVIEGESSDRFTELLAALHDEFNPNTATECALIETMATARWREMRLWSMEKAGIELEIASQAEANAHRSPATRAALAFRTLSDKSNSLELMNRYETRFDRQYCRALARLLDLLARRKKEKRKKQILPFEPDLAGEIGEP